MIKFPQFIPFFGVVEDNLDPLEIGRVRVRAHDFHSDNPGVLPTDHLPWFSNIVSNSGNFNGSGASPTGYLVGTTVFGYFTDHTLQTGIVLGALAGITNSVSDTSSLAVGGSHPIRDIRERNRIMEVQGPMENTEDLTEEELAKRRWSEPAYVNNASYPHNHVFETPNGIIREMDDTPNNERIHEYHPSGTYYEVQADGSRVVKVVGDGYEIIAGNKFIVIRGDVHETIDGNYNLYVTGNMHTQVDGNSTRVVQGNVEDYSHDRYTQSTGTHEDVSQTSRQTGDHVDIKGNSIKLNED